MINWLEWNEWNGMKTVVKERGINQQSEVVLFVDYNVFLFIFGRKKIIYSHVDSLQLLQLVLQIHTHLLITNEGTTANSNSVM
jgi:hypothetical protein